MASPGNSFDIKHLKGWHHPVTSPKARVLLIHGISEHSGRHLGTVAALNQAQIEVVRFDLRGSGQSGGDRQWIETFDDYVNDAQEIWNWIQGQLDELPLFLLGHRMGGAIAIYFAARAQAALQGVILSAPAYLLGNSISPLKIWLGRKVRNFIPKMRVPNGGDFGGVSRDPIVVEAYAKDPLCFHFTTIQQGDELLKAFEKIPEVASKIQLPLFMAHGTSDRIINPTGSFEIIRAWGPQPKELHFFPNAFHELHNDLDKELYFDLVNQWLAKRLQ